jgi:6-phosphofructokinase 1
MTDVDLGKIILVNEKASKHYSAHMINSIIEEESKGRFDTRLGIPGHFQQGKVPSPLDRARAIRFAVRSMEHLESYASSSREEIAKDPKSTAVIGIRQAKVSVTASQELEENETDWTNRRPLHAHWLHMKELGDILAGRPRDTTIPDNEASFTVG